MTSKLDQIWFRLHPPSFLHLLHLTTPDFPNRLFFRLKSRVMTYRPCGQIEKLLFRLHTVE